MENLTTKQWIEKYPYLEKIARSILFTSKEEVENLREGEKIEVDAFPVPIEFLKRILKDDDYFEYARRYFTDETTYFGVSYIIGGDTGHLITCNRNRIIKGIEKLIATGKITLDDVEQQRYTSLKNSISFDKYIEKNRDSNFDIDIDGKNYSFKTDYLLSLMKLPDEQFDELCSNAKIKELNGIPKEYIMYALLIFFKKTKALENYLIRENIVDRFSALDSLQKIDLQAINRHLKTEDTKYKEAHLNEELEEAILSGMPENMKSLEKAIYIYIKMCKILTYDDEYYAMNQSGAAAKKHGDIRFISAITPNNNKVVCFEFNMIYSMFLNKLGTHFCSEYKNMVGEDYGSAHASLEFRCGKFLISADSVTSILEGDIAKAKLNQPLVGLKCINTNEQTRKEFEEALTRVYQLIAKEKKNTDGPQKVEHIETLEELLEEYSHVTKNIREIPLEERLAILISKVNNTRMIGIDSLSYILQLRKILFDASEIENNIGVTIIRNNEPLDKNISATASAIFTLNTRGFDEEPDHNLYYYFNPNHELESITKEELQSKFDSQAFEYIEDKDPRIPGITENGGIKI